MHDNGAAGLLRIQISPYLASVVPFAQQSRVAVDEVGEFVSGLCEAMNDQPLDSVMHTDPLLVQQLTCPCFVSLHLRSEVLLDALVCVKAGSQVAWEQSVTPSEQ